VQTVQVECSKCDSWKAGSGAESPQDRLGLRVWHKFECNANMSGCHGPMRTPQSSLVRNSGYLGARC